jgi:hypothetical protein
VQVVAIDGYPIASGSNGQTSVSESVLLGPGARAEFVITTPKVGDQAQLVTQYWNTGPDGDYDPARPIANIVSQNGVESSAVHSASAVRRLPGKAVPMKVTRFADLAAATPVAQRNLYFSEVLLDPSNPLSPTTFFITEEGQTPAVFTMDQQPNIVVHSGTVEDWTIENCAQEDHIFHIHQIHFQVLAIDGQPVNDPAIRDTVDIPFWSGNGPYPSVTVRMDFRDPSIVGTFVYHCHILEHEDGGMMGEIQVLPSLGSASTTTATASALSISPNQNITLTANVVDTATGNPTPTGAVQFQLNGVNVGNPVALANGQATTAAMVNGNTGVNNLTAFLRGRFNLRGVDLASYPDHDFRLRVIVAGRDCGSRLGGDRQRDSQRGQQLHHGHQPYLHHALQPDRVGMLCGSEHDHRHRASKTDRKHHACAPSIEQTNRESRMAGRGRRREPGLRRPAGSASAQMGPARMAERGDKHACASGNCLYGNRVRRLGEDRSQHGQGHLRSRGYRHGGKQFGPVSVQRQRSDHHPVGVCDIGREERAGERRC